MIFFSAIRTVRINKTEQDFLGFHICGGNKVGIFVNEVSRGSPADLAGLKVGDKLLHVSNTYTMQTIASVFCVLIK